MFVHAKDKRDGSVSCITLEECNADSDRWEFIKDASVPKIVVEEGEITKGAEEETPEEVIEEVPEVVEVEKVPEAVKTVKPKVTKRVTKK